MRGEEEISTTRDRIIRGSLLVSGSALVAIFLAWVVYRNQAADPALGMETIAGWGAHIAAVLILLGGLALLARGIFGTPRRSGARRSDIDE